jgi:molecular chaperone GrpE (heat shock protein)
MNNAAKEHNVEVETLSKELEVTKEKLKRAVTRMESLKKRNYRAK